MADNLTIKDGAGASQVLATTDVAGVHTPKHIVTSSALPAGAATSAKQDSILAALAALATSAKQDTLIGHVDGLEGLLALMATAAKQDAIKASTDKAAPASGIIAVTPSDTVDLATVSRGIFVGTGGNISLICGGTTGLFKNVPSGTTLPVCASRVRATGTTAADIIALL
ncbi:spike base protein, RCAP_Rcc01079 family [Ancylobacter sp.]|uniref:spike base protein, RCAP_Rcc01079 family n=1 Tax=Ancylobacter sp. TaxID=1872567 RepID=UPI003C7E6BC1